MNTPGLNHISQHQLSNYHDISALQSIKHAGADQKDAQLDAVAKQFESIFVSMMIKSMRDANQVFAEGNMLKSNETDFYQQMFDSQLAVTLSSGKGIGLADVIKRQLSGTQVTPSSSGHLGPSSAPDYTLDGYTRKTFPERERLEQMYSALKKVEETLQQSESTNVQSPVADGAGVYDRVSDDRALDFSTPEKYIESLYPYAQSVEAETGVDARLMIAQSALETGWGKHQIKHADGTSSHNLFGIKANHGWDGEVAEITTTEYRQGIAMKERANFRAYDSYEDSFKDYAEFLQGNNRYQPAFSHLDDPKAFAHALQSSGYATDPQYGEKISRILDRYLLSENRFSADQLGESPQAADTTVVR